MIALYRGKSLPSRLIRWRTWSPYSHAAYLAADGSVYEAWAICGVSHNATIGTRHTPGTYVDVFDLKEPATDAQRREIEAFLLSECGKGYDYRGVLGFMSRRDKAQDPTRWFCSELIFTAYQRAGVKLFERIEPHRVDPGLLQISPLLTFVKTLRCG